MSYILLIIPLLLFIAIYQRKLKEPMIGYYNSIKEPMFGYYNSIKEPMINYCYSDKTPYHTKSVHLENKQLRRKVRTIRKALEDKATWEHNKINSYIPEYSLTQNNNLKLHPQEFELTIENSSKRVLNPIVTQFEKIESSDKTPSFYMAPKYQYNYTKRFNKEAPWISKPYNSKQSINHLDVLNFQN